MLEGMAIYDDRARAYIAAVIAAPEEIRAEYRAAWCTECGDLPAVGDGIEIVHDGVDQHYVVNGGVILGCEGYFIVAPRRVGITGSDQWQDWRDNRAPDGYEPRNHARCHPSKHDRSLPDDGGRPYGQPLDVNGFADDRQAIAADGLLGCNDCGLPLFYCLNDEWYYHVDPDAGCFLAGAWRPVDTPAGRPGWVAQEIAQELTLAGFDAGLGRFSEPAGGEFTLTRPDGSRFTVTVTPAEVTR